jgi:hypothetical protein
MAAELILGGGVAAEPARPPAGESTPVEQPQAGIFFREPRPVLVDVYETTDRQSNRARTYHRRSHQRVWIVDEHSTLGFVGFRSGVFNKRTAKIETSPAGTVSHVSATTSSTAHEVAAALSAAGGHVQASFEQATKVSDALTKLRARGADERLADLKRRKDELEADIAAKGLLATREQQEELARLKSEQDRVAALKQIGADTDALRLAEETRELRDELGRAKVELELLKTRADIGKLPSDGG